jgi:UDP-N-acetylmuramoylalanine--D-glutamate ligase
VREPRAVPQGAPLDPRLRRVLVVGASRSGLAAARALLAQGRQVVLSDTRAPDRGAGDPGSRPPADAVLDDPRLFVLAGPQGDSQLQGVDLVVKSPGVPGEIPLLEGARRRGIPVWSEVELAYRLLVNPFTAVTGTNGKTTTTTLIGHMFSVAGRPARVLGNVGTAASTVVGEAGPDEELVLEVSSFQLEDVHDFRPRAAVFLNLTPDHLDRHFTVDRYLACKARIFRSQRREDAAVLNVADPAGRRLAQELRGREGGPSVLGFSAAGPEEGLAGWSQAGWLHFAGAGELPVGDLALRGLHNHENSLAAGVAALARGLEFAAVAEALKTFAGVPHRLQAAGNVQGVAYVNDSKATNVEAALKALDAYPEGVHLILGGKDKASDYRPLAEACRGRCRQVYLIGEAAPLIAASFESVREAEDEGTGEMPPLVFSGDLERAVAEASQHAHPGEVVLLAPACASFDQYRDFEQRGEHFMELVGRMAAR